MTQLVSPSLSGDMRYQSVTKYFNVRSKTTGSQFSLPHETRKTAMVWYGIAGFNVPLETVQRDTFTGQMTRPIVSQR